MAKLKSDDRILAILRSGDDMCRLLDPDGILGDGMISSFSYSMGDVNDNWGVGVSFPSGDLLTLKGIASEDNILLISSAVLITDKQNIRIPVFGAETVIEAFGDLSGLPLSLKRNLASMPKQKPSAGISAFNCRAFFRLAKEALFCGMEGGGADAPYRGNFHTLTLRYSRLSSVDTGNVSIRSKTIIKDGRISVCSDVDIYGLSGKGVRLRYNLGLGHYVDSDCTLANGEHTMPSLRLAFDLASRLDGMYSKERREKKDMGKPKEQKEQSLSIG